MEINTYPQLHCMNCVKQTKEAKKFDNGSMTCIDKNRYNIEYGNYTDIRCFILKSSSKKTNITILRSLRVRELYKELMCIDKKESPGKPYSDSWLYIVKNGQPERSKWYGRFDTFMKKYPTKVTLKNKLLSYFKRSK